MQRGSFSQEVILYGTKGYLKAAGATVTGLIHQSDNKRVSVGSKANNENDENVGKETVLYQDSEDPDFLLIDRNIRNHEQILNSSPLIPSIYMDGTYNTYCI